MIVTDLDDNSDQEGMTYLALALGVVEQALRDIRNVNRKWETHRDCDQVNAKHAAEDARDFLLNRLWEEDNKWGNILRLHGVQRMTKARLVHTARRGADMEGGYE